MNSKYTIKFQRNGRDKSASFLLLGTFFLGPIYLLAFQMWAPAFLFFGISFVILLLLPILGIFVIIPLLSLPFFTEKLVKTWYLEQGWEEVPAGTPSAKGIRSSNGREKTTALERAQIALLEAQTAAIKKTVPAVSPSKAPSGVSLGQDGIPTYRL